jgi:Ca-activated chloride channel homolog
MRAFPATMLAAGLAAGLAFTASSAINAQQTTFRAGSDLVRVFATVTDRDGRLVTTLTRDQFEIRDEGKAQPITQFSTDPQPIRLIVLLDVSGSMEGNLPLLRSATQQLLTRLDDGDLMRIGSFGRNVTLMPDFTRNIVALTDALPGAIDPEAPTPLWRALDDGLEAFSVDDAARRVILVLTDGKDTGPLGFRDRPRSQAEIIDRARRDDVMIYAVGMRSRRARPSAPGIGPGGLQAMLAADLPDPGLARVAEETGGGYLEIRPGDNLGEAFAAVADELHTQYLIGFAPPKKDGKVHDIDVRVSASGMKPRARRSYVAARE